MTADLTAVTDALARALYEEWMGGQRIDPKPGVPVPGSIWHLNAAELLEPVVPLIAEARREGAADFRAALAELVALKDGARDGHYYEHKEAAWSLARSLLRASAVSGEPA